ncbi:MAG: GcvT [Haloplasmataceae bacterium]|nr:GcvT [Haloplasmataceae bacterium]
MGIKRTPLYEEHLKLGAKMVDFAGWEMPIQYSGITDEHLSVRNDVGIFDVSHMGEILIEGSDALAFVQNLVTNDVSKLVNQQVQYTLMCYEDGGVVDDLLVYRYDEFKILLVVNASNADKDFEWVVRHIGEYRVKTTNLSDSYGQVAVQGPNAEKIVQTLTNYDLTQIKFFFFTELEMNGSHFIVSRTGYTGEDGFEIYGEPKDIINLWQKFINLGVKPIALGARDTLRFEASLPLYGDEISDKITPLEASLGYFVKLDTDFIGKAALVKQKEAGLKRKLVGIKLLSKGILRHGYPVYNQDHQEIGNITTGYLLPDYEFAVALAIVETNYTNIGEKVLVGIRNKVYEAEVINKKFMDKKYKK